MTKAALLAQRGYFQMVHGVTLRLLSSFSEADLDFRPQEGMRSVRELATHVYAMEKALAEGIPTGKQTQEIEDQAIPESAAGKALLAALKTPGDLQAFARQSHAALDEVIADLTDEKLAQPFVAPYGTFPLWQFFNFMYDEHWHHRGQLYTYARLLGKEPPMLYDYENNAAA